MTFAIAFPAIDPVAVEIGPVAIRWYALSYVVGLLLGWQYVRYLAGRCIDGLTKRHADDLLVFGTLGVVLGGRLGYVLFYQPGYYFSHPGEIFQVWQGGMSFHGGAVGVIVVVILYTRLMKIGFLSVADAVCAQVPIGLFLGRMANFINGELYGRVSDVSWAMVFPAGGPEPRHPEPALRGSPGGDRPVCAAGRRGAHEADHAAARNHRGDVLRGLRRRPDHRRAVPRARCLPRVHPARYHHGAGAVAADDRARPLPHPSHPAGAAAGRTSGVVTALAAQIRERIRRDGPLSIAAYMELCLSHPAHGYYRRGRPIGAAGDFITAPEVSQMFGELVGLWCAAVWQSHGPAPACATRRARSRSRHV